MAGWEKNEQLHFLVAPITEEGHYQEQVGLRITGAYPFTGLHLIIEQQARRSAVYRSDTLTCHLMDEDGHVLGQGISHYQYDFPLARLLLQANDTLTVIIRHNMKRSTLPGITDVGLTLTRMEE